MSTLTLTIPRVPVGPNGPGGLLRMHYMRRSKYNYVWLKEIRAQIPEPMSMSGEGFQRSIVQIHQVRVALLDPDNLVASVKPCLDAMVHWGILKNDDAGHIDLRVTQEKGKPRRTEIRVDHLASCGYCEICKAPIYIPFSDHWATAEHRGNEGPV